MADEEHLLVEQDHTIARVAETSMRMMGGAVGPETMRSIREELKSHPESYPWERVCDLVVREAADPSDLVNRAIVAQRDWVQRGPRGAAPTAASRPKAPASNLGKRLLAMLLVRGTFYALIVFALVVILVLLERKWGFDIYAVGRSVQEFARGLFG